MLKETYIALRSILTAFCRQPFVVKCVSVKTCAQDWSISQVLDYVDNKSTSEALTPLSRSDCGQVKLKSKSDQSPSFERTPA